jgi:hypothetical protein
MATKHQQMQRLVHYFRETTGDTDVNVHSKEFIDFAIAQGWPLPKPTDARDLMADQFSQALREEIKQDKKTGLPYRVNHVYTVQKGEKQLRFWVDIDQAPRKTMEKSLAVRREQMVGDGFQLTNDADHWNSIHPEEKPIQISMDFREDIEERKAAPKEVQKKAS